MPRNVTVTLGDGSTVKYDGVPDDITPDQIAHRASTEAGGLEVKAIDGGKSQGAVELAKVAGSAIYGGLTALPRLAATGASWLTEGGKDVGTWRESIRNAIGSADTSVRDTLRPETRFGRGLANVGEAAIATVASPGGLVSIPKSLGIGTGAGVGAEAAALVGDNPLMRLVGGLVGGLGAGAAASFPTNAKEIIKRDTRAMTPEDWANARASQATTDALGVNTLATQHMGPRSVLADTMHKVSQNPASRPTLLSHLADVESQARTALDKQLLGISPKVTELRETLVDAQKAAKGVEGKMLEEANNRFEAAMPPQGGMYSGQHIDDIRRQLTELAMGDKYGANSDAGRQLLSWVQTHLPKPGDPYYAGRVTASGRPVIRPGTPGVTPEMSQHELNNLIKDLNKQIAANPTTWGNLPKKDLAGILKEATPEFNAARQAKRDYMTSTVNPFRESVAGQIARTGGGPQEGKFTATRNFASMLFPADRVQTTQIREYSRNVGQDSLGTLLFEHINSAFERAAQSATRGEQVPGLFVKDLAGSSSSSPRWANISTGIQELAKGNGQNPSAVVKGFREVLDGLATFKDAKISSTTEAASTTFTAGKSALGTLAAANSAIRRGLWERATAKTYQELARMATSPKGLQEFEAIARAPDFNTKSALIRGLLTSVMAESEKSPGVTAE
jgi:hypothetical protein